MILHNMIHSQHEITDKQQEMKRQKYLAKVHEQENRENVDHVEKLQLVG